MELYIVRHGKTYWNNERKIQGWADIDLTEEGRRVACESAEGMKDIHFDAIYSSPLKRAYETACILKGNRELAVIVDERIKEIGFGALEGADFTKIRGEKTSKFTAFFDAPECYDAPEGGESIQAVCDRAEDFLKEIIEKHKDDERIMIVAQGAVNKAMMHYIRQNEIKDFWEGSLQRNCGVTIVACRNGGFDVIEDNKVFYEYKKKGWE